MCLKQDSCQSCIKIEKNKIKKIEEMKNFYKELFPISSDKFDSEDGLSFINKDEFINKEKIKKKIKKIKNRIKYFKRKFEKIEQKINNLQNDFKKKFSCYVCNEYRHILISKFEVSNMVKKINDKGGRRPLSKKTTRKFQRWKHYGIKQCLYEKSQVIFYFLNFLI
jgi:chaperonin cofactor prefoldin